MELVLGRARVAREGMQGGGLKVSLLPCSMLTGIQGVRRLGGLFIPERVGETWCSYPLDLPAQNREAMVGGCGQQGTEVQK